MMLILMMMITITTMTETDRGIDTMNIQDNIEKIREKASEYAPKQLELLMELASFDSETNYVEGNARAVQLAKEFLEPLGGTVEEITYEKVGTHLLVRLIPENPKGRIVLNAHLDTVFPVGYAAQYPPHVEGDWLHGLGVFDCKGGLAVSGAAVQIAKELDLLPDLEIDLLYVCDEEQGSITGQEVYKKVCTGADAAFIFEPGSKDEENRIPIITSRQAVILGNLDLTGVEAHAGCAYSQGHSANKELAHKILELYALNDEERGIYYNAAPVSGGRPNGVVSGSANMQFCVAGIPDWNAYHEVEKKLEDLGSHTEDPGCTASISWRQLFPPQEHLPRSTDIYNKVAQAAELLGLKTKEDGVNPHGEDIHGAGDSNYIGELGVPAIDGFGPLGADMHAVTERIYIPSIQEKTELFAAFLMILNKKGL